MADTYNPHNAGAGGYLAVSPCGCTRGFTAYLDEDGRQDLIGWIGDGCTIRPLIQGEQIQRILCGVHASKP